MKLMRKNWKDRKGVSPVIATILMVAITVVLAAVLYVMVMGFGNPEEQTPNVALSSRSLSATDKTYEVYVVSVSGGSIAIGNVEAVVVSGPATTNQTGPVNDVKADAGTIQFVGGSHQDLQAGDKTTIKATGTGSVTVMFRDKVSGVSLGQTTFNVAS